MGINFTSTPSMSLVMLALMLIVVVQLAVIVR